MTLNPLKLLEQAINEHGSATILKERLTQASEQYTMLEKQLAQKEVELAGCRATISQLETNQQQLHLEIEQQQNQISRLNDDLERIQNDRNQFTEHSGAYFKKDGRGGYHDAVYCGVCKTPVAAGTGRNPRDVFRCKCGWQSSFTKGQEPQIRQSLP